MPRPTGAWRRPGFTLVELIVVISIVILLATLAVVFLPSFADTQRAGQGAEQLQKWLLIAKQRALRDQVPTGVRLIVSPVDARKNPSLVAVRDVEFIQQPDAFNPAGSTVR